jgi:hypothetical protein
VNNQYSSIALFDLTSDSKVAIAAVSVTPNEVVLSGAWLLPQNNEKDISLILSNRLAIPLTPGAEKIFSEKQFGYKKVSLADFISEAKADAKSGLDSFNEYKNQDLKKRKNLVAPTFFEWNETPDLLQATTVLESFGIIGRYEGSASEMESTHAAARLVQFFILKWHSDESARSGRKYVDGTEAELTILPRSWLA